MGNWWKYTLLGVLGVGGVVLVVVTAGGALVGGAAVAAYICGTAAVVSSGFGAKIVYDQDQKNEQANVISQQNLKIAEIQKRVEKYRNKAKKLATSIATIKANNDQLEQAKTSADAAETKHQNEIDALTKKLQAANRKIDDLQKKIDELGGGVSYPSELEVQCYYSSADINRCLNAVIFSKMPDIVYKDDCFIAKNTNQQSVLLLPAIISGIKAIQQLNHFLNRTNLMALMNDSTMGRVVFPYLDKTNNHWNTIELIIHKNKHSQYAINCSLHDPRGGGILPNYIADELRNIFKKNYHSEIELEITPSRFQSCRQSKPDKISCGPIVVEEILLLLNQKSLDRQIPYGYGASEIVARHGEIASVESKLQQRHSFLGRNLTQESIKNFDKQNIEEELDTLCLQ